MFRLLPNTVFLFGGFMARDVEGFRVLVRQGMDLLLEGFTVPAVGGRCVWQTTPFLPSPCPLSLSISHILLFHLFHSFSSPSTFLFFSHLKSFIHRIIPSYSDTLACSLTSLPLSFIFLTLLTLLLILVVLSDSLPSLLYLPDPLLPSLGY